MDKLISVAKIINFHGIKGEVKVGFTKCHEDLLLKSKVLSVKLNDTINVLNIQSVRFHKGYAIIKFKEFSSINDTLDYKNCMLYLEKETVKESLEEDEYFISDLKNMSAYDIAGNKLGIICEIAENNAGNIISIKDESSKIHMIPFVKELVPIVDIKNKKIVINNIEGLIN